MDLPLKKVSKINRGALTSASVHSVHYAITVKIAYVGFLSAKRTPDCIEIFEEPIGTSELQ